MSLEFRGRLVGAALAGALLAGLAAVAAGFLLRAAGAPVAAFRLARFVSGGGGLALMLWGAAAGALLATRWARAPRQAGAALLVAALAALLGWAAAGPAGSQGRSAPRGARAKSREILRASYRSPRSVQELLAYARDPSANVRELAVLALGVNLIVDDIEKATPTRPARFAGHPLRDSLRLALLAALRDPEEAVRAEAARALWKAPRTFGRQEAAAETLAAALERALTSAAPERLAWLALDAAAGAPHAGLKAAAGRFAAATADSDLARAARRAAFR